MELDTDDIKLLLKQCEEALSKIERTKAFLEKQAKLPVIVTGEETYGL